MGEGFHVDTNCARALGCELRLFRNLASGFVKRCLSNLIYFIVRGRGPTHFLNHFFWFLVLGHTWEVWFFGFFFLELGLNFFPSDGLYTVMYIDSYMEAAAAAVCTWAGCVLFFFPPVSLLQGNDNKEFSWLRGSRVILPRVHFSVPPRASCRI